MERREKVCTNPWPLLTTAAWPTASTLSTTTTLSFEPTGDKIKSLFSLFSSVIDPLNCYQDHPEGRGGECELSEHLERSAQEADPPEQHLVL